jgi:AraC-like DNA-binding protein/dienelactone hydrolase
MKPSTGNDYRTRIGRVLAHIAGHLDAELSLAELAAIAHVSPYHFHRLFRAMTGESVAALVRRLRLETAARALRESDAAVIDVALAAGYGAPEAFSRAFHAGFGMAPSEFRRVLIPPRYTPPLSLELRLDRAGMRLALEPSSGGTELPVAIETLPDRLAACLRHVGPYDDVPTSFERLYRWALLADPEFGPRIDRQRIGAAGFSLGGYTMMALAGGITSIAQFETFCQERQGQGSCKMPPEFPDLRERSQALAKSDRAYAAALGDDGKSYRDPRIRAVFAMAPALGPVFTSESLAAIAIPVAIVAGEGDPIVPIAENARPYAATIPHAELTVFPGAAGHYVFLDQCTEAGRQSLPGLCVDAPGVDRAAIHQATAEAASKFFDTTLH